MYSIVNIWKSKKKKKNDQNSNFSLNVWVHEEEWPYWISPFSFLGGWLLVSSK